MNKQVIITASVILGLRFLFFFRAEGDICKQYSNQSNSISVNASITEVPVTATDITTSFVTSETIPETTAITVAVTECSSDVVTTTEDTIITELPVTEETVQGVINGEILYDTEYVEYPLPENPDYWGFKSYEPYYLITAQSIQLCLQYDAITDSNGFRLLDGRYLVAVGTFCNELSDKYDAGSNMKGIFRLAYTPETETIALFRTFFFKEDYMIVIDDELKEISCSIIDKW